MKSKAKFSSCLLLLLSLILILSCNKDGREDVVTPGNQTESTAQNSGLLLLDQGTYQGIPLIDEPLVNVRTSEKAELPDDYIIPNLVPVGNQGEMESCVGWATGYASRTLLYQQGKDIQYLGENGAIRTDLIFSPEFIWTSINKGKNNGVFMPDALNLIQNVGALKLADFPTKFQASPGPSEIQKQSAAVYKVKNWGRISINTLSFRKFLFFNNPIIIALRPDENFKNPEKMLQDGSLVWDKYGTPGAGHACAIVGYSKERNAFLIQNSWGKRWGKRLSQEDSEKSMAGFIWLDYNLLQTVVLEAYVMIANDSDSEKPVVNTLPLTVNSEYELALWGSVEKFEDKALTEYGFIVSTDSTELEINSKAELLTYRSVLSPPYKFAKLYTTKASGKRFYRAYAKSYSEVYYGKISDFFIQAEIDDSGRLAGDMEVSAIFENRFSQTPNNSYTEYHFVREFKFDITFSEIHQRYKYRALYLFTADGSYFTVSGISEGPRKTAIAYLDLSDRIWQIPSPNGGVMQEHVLPDVPLYKTADLSRSPADWVRAGSLFSNEMDRFMVVMSDDPDFAKNVIKTDEISFPKRLNSEEFKPKEKPPQPFVVSF